MCVPVRLSTAPKGSTGWRNPDDDIWMPLGTAQYRVTGNEVVERISVQVANTRKVDWTTFRPNFYYIFPPEALSALPHTFMTSFYLPMSDVDWYL